MNKGPIRLMASGWLLAMTGTASAELPPIFITAGRVAEPVEETLYSTSSVSAEEIERRKPRDVADILGQLPGIEIGRNGGAGQVTSVFIRGAESDQTLLLVDGVPVNSGTAGAPAFQHFMPDQIERIEVVRGPASTLYGSGAIGGVVQIFTKRQVTGTSTNVTAGGGSENSRNYSGNFAYGKQGTFANLSVSHRDTDGYRIQPSVLPADRGYENTSFNGAIGSRFGDFSVELSYFHSDGFVEYIGRTRPAFPDLPEPIPVDQDTRNSVARLVLDYDTGESWRSRLLLGRTRDEIEQNQFEDFADTERDYIDWQNTISLDDRQTLVAGVTANWTDTKFLSSAGTFFETRYDERIRSLEYYIQDTIELGDTRLQIGGRAIDNEQYGDNYTWNLAIGHRLNDSVRIHANAGSAFRAPTGNELAFGGNPDLDAETSVSGEIGLDYDVARNHRLSAAVFQNNIDDLIEFRNVAPPGGFDFKATQVEKARIRGVELGYRMNAGPWTLATDYTYQDAENRSQNQRLLRRARNIANARIGYSQADWWTEAAVRYQDERPDFNTRLGSYTTVDVSAGYRFSPSVSISGRIQNLFDEDYELADTYDAQGRFIGAELRYDYQAN